MQRQEEFFGSPEQKDMMQRAAALWHILRDDRRISFYGRAVSLTDHSPDSLELLISLTRLQGASSCLYVPSDDTGALRQALEGRGFNTDQFELLRGQQDALDACRGILATHVLPADLDVITFDESTSDELMAGLNQVTASCDVLLPLGSVMRGVSRRAICMMARDGNGEPVASAASVALNHEDGPRSGDAWWGMLATREERRGERIALVLGAMAMIAMHERHGFTNFMTGVRKGNTASEKLCARLSVLPSSYAAVGATDPASFTGERMTK